MNARMRNVQDVHAGSLMGLEHNSASPETQVLGACELSSGCWEPERGPLQGLLITEPLLQPCSSSLFEGYQK